MIEGAREGGARRETKQVIDLLMSTFPLVEVLIYDRLYTF